MSFIGQGTGTSGDPYQITTIEELNDVRNHLGSYFKLMNDLDFDNPDDWDDYDTNRDTIVDPTSGWLPIGAWGSPFTGNLDGNNKTITNLFFNRSIFDAGLFGFVNECEINDLGLIGVQIEGTSSYVASLFGYGSAIVNNCYAKGNISGNGYVGGLIGYITSPSEINNCYVKATVTAIGNCAGGLMAHSFNGNVSNCFSESTVSGKQQTGGLFGSNAGTISHCYSKGETTGTTYVGGLVGYAGGTISGCYSIGEVNGISEVGGLTGRTVLDTNNCYTHCKVTRISGTSERVGGFSGFNDRRKIVKCYSTGEVIYADDDNPENKGFCGEVDTAGNYEMSDNFWDVDSSNQTTTAGDATGLSTENMQKIITFNEWNIETLENFTDETWKIDDNKDYPILGWQLVKIRKLKIGDELVERLYKGDTKIIKVYKGDKLVFGEI